MIFPCYRYRTRPSDPQKRLACYFVFVMAPGPYHHGLNLYPSLIVIDGIDAQNTIGVSRELSGLGEQNHLGDREKIGTVLP